MSYWQVVSGELVNVMMITPSAGLSIRPMEATNTAFEASLSLLPSSVSEKTVDHLVAERHHDAASGMYNSSSCSSKPYGTGVNADGVDKPPAKLIRVECYTVNQPSSPAMIAHLKTW